MKRAPVTMTTAEVCVMCSPDILNGMKILSPVSGWRMAWGDGRGI